MGIAEIIRRPTGQNTIHLENIQPAPLKRKIQAYETEMNGIARAQLRWQSVIISDHSSIHERNIAYARLQRLTSRLEQIQELHFVKMSSSRHR